MSKDHLKEPQLSQNSMNEDLIGLGTDVTPKSKRVRTSNKIEVNNQQVATEETIQRFEDSTTEFQQKVKQEVDFESNNR